MDSRGNFNHVYPQLAPYTQEIDTSILFLSRALPLIPFLAYRLFCRPFVCLDWLPNWSTGLQPSKPRHYNTFSLPWRGQTANNSGPCSCHSLVRVPDLIPSIFLDSAPIIKPPLDLGDTDSDEEASETASSVSLGSVSTTTSTHPTQASTSTASPQAPRPILKPRPAMPDKVSSIEYAEACIPTSLSDIHHAGIPPRMSCKRSEKTTARGASLYICPHRDCGATPYVGDLYGCSSHLRTVHFGTCLICPYCSNQRYYRASGWKAHMSSKHSSVPWFGALEATQASLMLAAIQEDISASGSSQEPMGVKAEVPSVQLPRPEEISTIPLHPTQEEDPLEESLPFAPDATEEDLTLEQEQELLEEEGAKPRPPYP